MTMHELTIKTPNELTRADIEEIVRVVMSPDSPAVEIWWVGTCLSTFRH